MQRATGVMFVVGILMVLHVTAVGAGDGNWQLRFGGAFLSTHGGVSVDVGPGAGVATSIGTGAGVGFGAERRLSPRLGLELGLIATGPEISVKVGGSAGGSVVQTEILTFVPVTVGLNIHLTKDSPVDVYVGPMLAFVQYSGVQLDTGEWPWVDLGDIWPTVHTEQSASTFVGNSSEVTWGLNAGADIRIASSRWSVTVGFKYLETSLEMQDGGRYPVNPSIFCLGAGFRF